MPPPVSFRKEMAMSEMIAKKFFPKSMISTTDGGGNHLTQPKQGVWVELWKNEKQVICAAEVYSNDQEEYVDVGLSVEDGELVDYDGVFSLPREVVAVLREAGVRVPRMMVD